MFLRHKTHDNKTSLMKMRYTCQHHKTVFKLLKKYYTLSLLLDVYYLACYDDERAMM